ncbi:bifunctional 2-polyprenyl-6-hydroxyphenol methylase/3-demethylubiquinol 3-O-methyltransferase UbiG [Candidatus Nitrosacidococcus tergens]|uniref:Ubiquinone biosynthesis O-methyltransferase n=1 Tax=Candidatus Nitrosacidococcus tergens TaxID=553981 RepID=A0A7G1Q889_9GAMM|nr:bifunctional 2-polyprenyl-6-hydroxyphenol methylase/3-demethylubiquinol 3-O-methyltransferase UbiG [Candidatus Nitrosacidococcus tergens]CAB1274859.1 bifunctional 3-demethylubiquinone-9 3-methyltransferase and 2-octaprenyl-6-hydroxy phenol methylase [Candidatus Nitrosacidococcus tergens]
MNKQLVNVDLQEIGRFNTLAHNWWESKGEFRTLHHINPIRMKYICSHSCLVGKKALDVGCGGGLLTESLAKLGSEVTGIDLGYDLLTVARLHALESGLGIDYQQISVEDLASEKSQSFDIITCLEMLEHVPDPAGIIHACAQLLKPGGIFFFSTLNRTLKGYLFGVVGAEYIGRIIPKGTHDYKRFILPSELESWCRLEHLNIEEFIGLHYNPINQTCWLNSDISVNYIGYAIKS